MPKFSIVTPVYNPPAEALKACIASMKSQSFKDWEWCVVDDKSTQPHVRAKYLPVPKLVTAEFE